MPPAKKRKIQDISGDDSPASTPDPTASDQNNIADTIELATAALAATNQEPETPSKRGRGRPKGAKNKRTPTPEGDIPPEERYFFQTRQGPANAQPVSTNSFSALGLLNHDDYLAGIRDYKDPHELEMRYLHKLHARAFPQWKLELAYGYTVCLYGWGSKRSLVTDFAEYLCRRATKTDQPHPKIVVINGYTHKLNIRFILNTINAVLQSSDSDDEDTAPPARLIGQPQDILDTLLSRLSSSAEGPPIYLLINSLDHPSSPLRSPQLQSLLSRLSSHPRIRTLMTCDTPTFNLLFPSSIRQSYNLIFHDATTFAPYDVETSVIDDVNELLGRKGRRAGGTQGISFVLKSLPENAQNLYRLLLSEILTIIADDTANTNHNHNQSDPDNDDNETNDLIDPALLPPGPAASSKGKPPTKKAARKKKTQATSPEEITIPYRTLYQKASEEFICSSDMNFRFLLKEFLDHAMITTGRDKDGVGGGEEVLGVPLGVEEMESVLEGLI